MAQESKSNYAIIPSINEFLHKIYYVKLSDPIFLKKVSFRYACIPVKSDVIFIDIPLEGLTNNVDEDEDEILAIGISGNPILSNLHNMITQIADSFIREYHPDPFPENNNNKFLSRLFMRDNYRSPLSEGDIQDYVNQVVNNFFHYNKKKNSCQLRFRVLGSTYKHPTPVERRGSKLLIESLGDKQYTGTIKISHGTLLATKNDVSPYLNFSINKVFVEE